MNKLRSFWLFGLFALLVGCATAPIDTVGKRFAAFEIAYAEVNATATRLLVEGRLSAESAAKLDQLFKDTDKLRLVAYEVRYNQGDEAANQQLQLLNAALLSLRAILAEAEK